MHVAHNQPIMTLNGELVRLNVLLVGEFENEQSDVLYGVAYDAEDDPIDMKAVAKLDEEDFWWETEGAKGALANQVLKK